MASVSDHSDGGATVRGNVILRPPRPGDIGWVVAENARFHCAEFGWDLRFEAFVAGLAAQSMCGLDSTAECCWIAELDGEAVGGVCLIRDSDTVAKIRLLLVTEKARGAGIGRRLVGECIAFARCAGYRQISLWTDARLMAARRLYEQFRFRLVGREKDFRFGPELLGENWVLDL